MCGDGKTEREVRRRAQVGANAGRALESDLKKTQGQGLEHLCDTACQYGTEPLAMTELHKERLQVCENNWV